MITSAQLLVASRSLRLVGAIRTKGHSLTDEALRLDWIGINIVKQANEQPMRIALRGFFAAQENESLANLRRLAPVKRGPAGLIMKAEADSIASSIFNIDFWKEEVDSRFGKHILNAVLAGFETAQSRLSVSGLDFSSDRPAVKRILRQVLSKTRGINDTVLKQLVANLSQGLIEGDDLDALIDRAARTWDLARSRLNTIVQTALTPAFEVGQLETYEEVGVDKKRWLSQRDGAVRRRDPWNHWEPDGQTVDIKKDFTVSGERLGFPGDTKGSKQNIIGCRCSTQPVL